MAWPDLTLVAEGAVTRLVWAPDTDQPLGPIRFAACGDALVGTDKAKEGLARVVEHVLERLTEEGLPKTRLAAEWATVAKTDDAEREFCQTVARLGLDPYSVSDQTAADVISVASSLPGELVADFFDSADATALVGAAEWAQRAMLAASEASARARESLSPLYEVVAPIARNLGAGIERPWVVGYAMARQVRRELDVPDTDRFDTSPWVEVGDVSTPSNGIQGIASVDHDRCGLVLGGLRGGLPAGRPTELFGGSTRAARTIGPRVCCGTVGSSRRHPTITGGSRQARRCCA
jgi:hypothetical protein